MQRNSKILLFSLVVCLLWSAVALAASTPKYTQGELSRVPNHLRTHGGSADDAAALSAGRVFGTPVTVGAAPAASPGLRVGETTYDFQHNGSTSRQVDQHNGLVQVTWMKGTQFSTALGRQVYWNKTSVSGPITPVTLDNGGTVNVLPLGTLGSPEGQAAVTGGNRPGYTTFRNLPTGRGIAFMHDAPEQGTGAFPLAAVDASANFSGVFIGNPMPNPPQGIEAIWPHGCTDVVGSDTVLHAVTSESGGLTDYSVWYVRGVLSGGGTTITWDDPLRVDTVSTLSIVVEQDPNSDNVAIVYSKARILDSQVDNDVVYKLSTNGGVSWSSRINVTNYLDGVDGERAYVDLDALYDEDGTLHIIWPTGEYIVEDDIIYWLPCDLWHWNSLRNTRRMITSFPDEPNSCDLILGGFHGGLFNSQIAKPNIVVKPADADWMNGTEILYAVWVQFGPTTTDCGTQDSAGTLGGVVNGEIWVSASTNDGLTWDRPQNVTGTETPDCLPGDCHSENWVSAARTADSGVYISYVDDSHSGAVIADDPVEGVWSTSPYRVLAIEARMPVLEPRISVSPTNFTELHVLPGGTATVDVTINNVGNADLTFDVAVTNDDGGGSHVLVNGSGSYNNTIAAAGAPDVVTVTFDGIGLSNPSEWNWRLEVTSNDAANDPGQGGTPIDVNLNVFVADPWYTCVSDTISTGLHRLAVGSCLELGDQDGGQAGMFTYTDSSEWLYDASPVLARLDGATKLAYRDIFWQSVEDRSRDSNRAFRAQSDISVTRTGTSDVATGVAFTTDSLIKLDWEVTAYKGAGLQNGAVAKYVITNRTGSTFNDVHLGAAADFDIDSASAANDGIADETNEYVGGRGGVYDTSGTVYTPLPYYAALFYVPLDATCSGTGVGGQVLDNEDYIYTLGAYDTDTLYNWMSGMLGWNATTLQADTITDLNVVMSDRQNQTLGPNDTLTYGFGVVVSDVDETDLATSIDALRAAANTACGGGECPITLTGDVNLSTTVTAADIIYLVGFVFKGGPAPQPCTASGDVNCSGTVTAADIIYLVGFVFKGGPAPCDACTVIDSYPDC